MVAMATLTLFLFVHISTAEDFWTVLEMIVLSVFNINLVENEGYLKYLKF
jgi:hypothetical protein